MSRSGAKEIRWSGSALEPRLMLAADVVAASEIVQPPVAGTETAADTETNGAVVMVDSTLEDIDALLAGVDPTAEIVLLDPELDFVGQVSAVLRGREQVASLHLVTHGQAGALILGEQTIDAHHLRTQGDEIHRWRKSFTTDADIFLYGCHTGARAEGRDLMSVLAIMTGTDVAASTDRTGAASTGGDWHLERTIGRIDSPLAFAPTVTERYKHSLDITVTASGSTGSESMLLLIDDQAVQRWDVGTEQTDYTYETSDSIVASSVKVQFTNDLYQPELGVDRNLTVDKVSIDGVEYQSEDQRTFSTGTWLAEDGVVAGFGRGEILHTNGTFQYDLDAPSGAVEFEGQFWNQNSAVQLSVANGQLNVSPTRSDGGTAWTAIAAEGGVGYEFSVDGYRAGFGSGFAGVDFFDEEGVEIDEVVLTLNEQRLDNVQTINVVAPEQTAFATIWVYAGQQRFSPGGSFVAQINSVSLEQTDAADTTPPSAEFGADGQTITQIRQSLNLGVRYADDFAISEPGRIRVSGPNGFEQVPAIGTGVIDSVADQTLIYSIQPSSGEFTPEDNGLYTVTLIGNTLRDTSGNAAAEQVLGSFTLNLSPSQDQVPPTARLTTIETTVRPEGFVEFSVVYRDDQPDGFRSGSISERYIVEGPGFSNRAVSPIAGGGNGPNELFEVIRLTPEADAVIQPGEYFVTLVDDAFFDAAGNAVVGGPLGSFRVV
ncbi:MAG: DUF4347 domain-containing protein [Planctomycetota bacterium]